MKESITKPRGSQAGLMRGRVLLMVVCGTVILAFSFGIRSTFGLFLQPMSQAMGSQAN